MIDIDASVRELVDGPPMTPFTVDDNAKDVRHICKTQADLDRYAQLIAKVQPMTIVEIGSGPEAGSSLWFHEQNGAEVLSVDMLGHSSLYGVTYYQGNSQAPGTVRFVHEWVSDRAHPVLVSIDGDHSLIGCFTDLVNYSPLVTPGSYLVVEDTIHHFAQLADPARKEGDPWLAMQAFLGMSDDWEQDSEIELLSSTTQFPGGWLRRL